MEIDKREVVYVVSSYLGRKFLDVTIFSSEEKANEYFRYCNNKNVSHYLDIKTIDECMVEKE